MIQQQMADLHQATGCRVVRDVRRSGTRLSQLLEFDGDADALADKLQRYMNSGWVEYAQPDLIYYPAAPAPTPNDFVYNAYPGPQWSLPIIHGPEAWGIHQGNPSVIIAVADSGAPVNKPPLFPAASPHPDFALNIWQGQNSVPGEIRNFYGNNFDVSDDFVGDDPDHPAYHGTHVASIIGARGNNEIGMSGVAWNTSLMILKVMGPCGNFAPPCPSPPPGAEQVGFSSSVSGAVEYARNHGAAAINCSFFGQWFGKDNFQYYDPDVTAAIAAAREGTGMLVVAAAVNANDTNDDNRYVNNPTTIPLDNIISVGATTIDDQKASYSNFGIYRVDLGAPGGSITGPAILGLMPTFDGFSDHEDNYNFLWGTSFAAPHVSGAVALVKSKYPWENYLGIKDRILMGVDHLSQFNTVFRTKGRLNLFRALHKRTLIRNISTRAFVGSGEQILIGGFTISGQGDPGAPTLRVCVRGMGPSVGVSPVLQNPKIQIFTSNGQPLDDGYNGTNDDWADDMNADQLKDLEPSNGLESALVRDLEPGAYTVHVTASPGTPLGIGLVEIYELSDGMSERSRLINLSTRCFVGTGDNVAIAGTIVGGTADAPALPDRRILMLGRGPSLGYLGVPNPLFDPALELRNSSGVLMESNNTWTDIDGPIVNFSGGGPLAGRVMSGNALEGKLVSAGFFECAGGLPASSQEPCTYINGTAPESVLWPTLRSGEYTATLKPALGTPAGIGLIEFYEY